MPYRLSDKAQAHQITHQERHIKVVPDDDMKDLKQRDEYNQYSHHAEND